DPVAPLAAAEDAVSPAGAVRVDVVVVVPVQVPAVYRDARLRPPHVHRHEAHPGLDQLPAEEVAEAPVPAPVGLLHAVRLAGEVEGGARLRTADGVEGLLVAGARRLDGIGAGLRSERRVELPQQAAPPVEA